MKKIENVLWNKAQLKFYNFFTYMTEEVHPRLEYSRGRAEEQHLQFVRDETWVTEPFHRLSTQQFRDSHPHLQLYLLQCSELVSHIFKSNVDRMLLSFLEQQWEMFKSRLGVNIQSCRKGRGKFGYSIFLTDYQFSIPAKVLSTFKSEKHLPHKIPL